MRTISFVGVWVLLVLAGLPWLSLPVSASSSFEVESIRDKHHVTADRTLYHSKEDVYEAFGHVVVSSKGQRLSCDYLWVDSAAKEMKARGNVLYVDEATTIEAAEMNFNLDTGIGSIFYGKVANDYYSLKGQLIRKVSPDRFLTTEGEYTTCKDCAESWKIAARDVDMTLDGYAFMNGVFVKIKDIPTLYLPYLIVPVKTRRQTGLLFPRIGAMGNNGFVYMQPLFITLGEHQDITVTAGKYWERGFRYEFEHRYQSYNGINGQFNFFRTNERSKSAPSHHRTALKSENTWPVSKKLQMRWRLYEVWDRDYPIEFPEDMPGKGLPALESGFVATSPWDDFFLSAELRRYRNLVYDHPKGFDGGMVQALPVIHGGLRERRLAGPFLGSFYGRFDAFRRHNGSFFDANGNREFDAGLDTIREADRLILQPEISAPFHLGSFLQIIPSVQWNEIRYNFAVPTANGPVPSTQTRYLLTKVEASTVLEKVMDYDGEKVHRLKHQLAPFLTFSNIPWINQGDQGRASHPFNGAQGQLDKTSGLFDQYDIVPYTNDTNFLRFPQGKSLNYGFTSRLVRKFRGPNDQRPRSYPYDLIASKPKQYPDPLNKKMEIRNEEDRIWDQYAPQYGLYQEIWTVNVSQAYDFKVARKQKDLGLVGDPKRAFSFLLAKSDLAIENFSHTLEYRFFPRVVRKIENSVGQPLNEQVFKSKHFITTQFTWYLKNMTNLRKTKSFVRSVTGNFTNSSKPNPSRTVGGGIDWSFNDYASVKIRYDYDLLLKKQSRWNTEWMLTHWSECWGMLLGWSWDKDRGEGKRHREFKFQLLFNLMGTGFVGADSQAQSGPGSIFGGL